MITWANSDTLSSWKKLLSLKGMVSVKDQVNGSFQTDAQYYMPDNGIDITEATINGKMPRPDTMVRP